MSAPRTLVVYYSRTGTTRRLATDLAKALGADIDEIHDAGGRMGFVGYWRSVSEARGRRATVISPALHDPAAYDLVVIGTPVWAWSLSSPVRAYLTLNRPRLPDIAFFATLGGAGADSAFAQMHGVAGKPPRQVLAVTAAEVAAKSYGKKLLAFVDTLLTPSAATAALRSAA
jgi:hypothetical protein